MGKVRRGKAKNADDSSICEKENDSDSNTSDKIAEWRLQSSGMWCCVVMCSLAFKYCWMFQITNIHQHERDGVAPVQSTTHERMWRYKGNFQTLN